MNLALNLLKLKKKKRKTKKRKEKKEEEERKIAILRPALLWWLFWGENDREIYKNIQK